MIYYSKKEKLLTLIAIDFRGETFDNVKAMLSRFFVTKIDRWFLRLFQSQYYFFCIVAV